MKDKVFIDTNIFVYSALDDEEERPLGLFYATSILEKRIFVRPHIYTLPPSCERWYVNEPEEDGRLSFWDAVADLSLWGRPVYLLAVRLVPGGLPWDLADQECFDCRLRGGTLQKPNYW